MTKNQNNKQPRKMKVLELGIKILARKCWKSGSFGRVENWKYWRRCDLGFKSHWFAELCASLRIFILSLISKSLLLATRWLSNNWSGFIFNPFGEHSGLDFPVEGFINPAGFWMPRLLEIEFPNVLEVTPGKLETVNWLHDVLGIEN